MRPVLPFHVRYLEFCFLFNEFLAFFSCFTNISCLISSFIGHCRRLIGERIKWEDHIAWFRPLAGPAVNMVTWMHAAKTKHGNIENVAHSHRFQGFQVILKIRVYRHLRRVPTMKNHNYVRGKVTATKTVNFFFVIVHSHLESDFTICSSFPLKQKNIWTL